MNKLTISLPETIVQTAMPTVISNTDRYLETAYRLRKIHMPIIMLAISEPWKNARDDFRILTSHGYNQKIKVPAAAHRSENHVQGHRDVKVKGIVVGHTGHEEHEHEQQVVLEADLPLLGTEFLSHYKAL